MLTAYGKCEQPFHVFVTFSIHSTQCHRTVSLENVEIRPIFLLADMLHTVREQVRSVCNYMEVP
jgi:hypothetical protein